MALMSLRVKLQQQYVCPPRLFVFIGWRYVPDGDSKTD